MNSTFKVGARVRSLRWAGVEGKVIWVDRNKLSVLWDGYRSLRAEEPGHVALIEPTTGGTDVVVHHTRGCDLCGRTDRHTHTQREWRALIDGKGGTR